MTKQRKFGFTVGTAFLILAGVAYWRGHMLPSRIFGGLGATLIVMGLVVPTWLGPVERAWMAMALIISKVTTPLFMGLAYYLAVVPIGLVRRMTGNNSLVVQEKGGSYWHDRSDEPKSDMERQF
jgi:hypothetical protein